MSEALQRTHPDAPVVPIDPDTVRDVLRRLIRDRGERQAIADRGRPFVSAVHDADRIAERLEAVYRAPANPVPNRAMPDWSSMARARRIEALETRVDRLEVELGRARRREAELRVRLGLPEIDRWTRARSAARRVVPDSLGRRLRRGRGQGPASRG
jgi:hypothetical protein